MGVWFGRNGMFPLSNFLVIPLAVWLTKLLYCTPAYVLTQMIFFFVHFMPLTVVDTSIMKPVMSGTYGTQHSCCVVAVSDVLVYIFCACVLYSAVSISMFLRL